jgi:hypothetical protein
MGIVYSEVFPVHQCQCGDDISETSDIDCTLTLLTTRDSFIVLKRTLKMKAFQMLTSVDDITSVNEARN